MVYIDRKDIGPKNSVEKESIEEILTKFSHFSNFRIVKNTSDNVYFYNLSETIRELKQSFH